MCKTAKTIAICNQKGGVGKTVTTVNLGIGLARQGKRVLLVDVDPQGSLTASLGYHQPDRIETTLSTVLGKIVQQKPFDPARYILHQDEGVDLLPANIDLAMVEMNLVGVMGRETVLPYSRPWRTAQRVSAIMILSMRRTRTSSMPMWRNARSLSSMTRA